MDNHQKPALAYLPHENEEYYLGALPPRLDRNGQVLYNAPPVSSAVELIPRSKWTAFDSTLKRISILDQNGWGACVGYATCAAVMKARLKAGMTFRRLSPTFIYANGNGNRDAGMIISDAADLIRQIGVAPWELFPDKTIWKQNIPDEAYAEAKRRFLVTDVYKCSSFDEIGTAIQLGWDVVYGISVGTSFNDLNADGVPGFGLSRGGHALTDGEGMKKGSKGNWLVKTRNSWRESWGLNGFCYLSEDHFSRSGYIDAFAIRSLITDPEETDVAKPLVM